LYNFDTGSTTVPTGWAPGKAYLTTDAGLNAATLSVSLTEGKFCPGALKAVLPFTSYTAFDVDGGAVGAVIQYATGTGVVLDWTGKTKLHGWAKIDTSNGVGHLGFIQLYANTADYGHYISAQPSGGIFADGAWHEMIVDLTGNGFVLTNVKQYGLQVSLKSTAPSAGPVTPVTTTVYLDDLWLE
jgi:hypothetical protein